MIVLGARTVVVRVGRVIVRGEVMEGILGGVVIVVPRNEDGRLYRAAYGTDPP